MACYCVDTAVQILPDEVKLGSCTLDLLLHNIWCALARPHLITCTEPISVIIALQQKFRDLWSAGLLYFVIIVKRCKTYMPVNKISRDIIKAIKMLYF